MGVGHTFRIGDGVHQTGVHRRQAGGVGVTEPGDLHGCRLSSERRQPVQAGMPGQINQDVDAVGPDSRVDFGIGEAMHRGPGIGHCAETGGVCVPRFGRQGGISVNRIAGPIGSFHDRSQEISSQMLTVIDGQPADA